MEHKLMDTLIDAVESKSFAIGNDVVFVPDFENMLNELFKKKVYTDNEIAYCEQFSEPVLRYASTWAAKEAVYKAVKQLNSKTMGFKAIEIIREKPSGKPGAKLLKHKDQFNISLSISHDGEYVWAVAIAERTCPFGNLSPEGAAYLAQDSVLRIYNKRQLSPERAL